MNDTTLRIVVVTGGTRGIGRAICLTLADSNTYIFFNYLSSDNHARELERQIKSKGGQAHGIKADISNAADVDLFLKQALEKTGKIDVLVNNAGISKDGLIVRTKVSDWDRIINTNLKGVFLCTKIVARSMIKNRFGRIINISSIVGVTGNPGQSVYAASKAGIIGFTKSTAKELASKNITANVICPGYIETDMTTNLDDSTRSQMIQHIPLGRPGTPDEVACLAQFLSSEKASYITGQVIHVNGGMYG